MEPRKCSNCLNKSCTKVKREKGTLCLGYIGKGVR